MPRPNGATLASCAAAQPIAPAAVLATSRSPVSISPTATGEYHAANEASQVLAGQHRPRGDDHRQRAGTNGPARNASGSNKTSVHSSPARGRGCC